MPGVVPGFHGGWLLTRNMTSLANVSPGSLGACAATGTPESQRKLGLGSGQGKERGNSAVGLWGTKAGEKTEAEVDGTVWPRSQQPAQDAAIIRGCSGA